jgi:hypothetical protein
MSSLFRTRILQPRRAGCHRKSAMKSGISGRALFGLLTSGAAGPVVGGRAARAADGSSEGMVPFPSVTD